MELLPDVLVFRRVHQENISVESDKGTISAAMKEQLFYVLKASLDRKRRSVQAERRDVIDHQPGLC